jgi:hypothetical protein
VYVIRIVGLINGRRTHHDGKYVFAYNPGPDSYPPQQCRLVTVSTATVAKHYPSHADALAEWLRVDPRQPTRPWDGKPNRPLTAYTVSIEQV